MNTTPMKHGRPLWEPGCGRLMMRNTEVAFWQSRMTVDGVRADAPELTDLRSLALNIRACFAEEVGHVLES